MFELSISLSDPSGQPIYQNKNFHPRTSSKKSRRPQPPISISLSDASQGPSSSPHPGTSSKKSRRNSPPRGRRSQSSVSICLSDPSQDLPSSPHPQASSKKSRSSPRYRPKALLVPVSTLNA